MFDSKQNINLVCMETNEILILQSDCNSHIFKEV
jgi:hypothetical protein